MNIRGCPTIFGAFSLLSIGIAALVDPISRNGRAGRGGCGFDSNYDVLLKRRRAWAGHCRIVWFGGFRAEVPSLIQFECAARAG